MNMLLDAHRATICRRNIEAPSLQKKLQKENKLPLKRVSLKTFEDSRSEKKSKLSISATESNSKDCSSLELMKKMKSVT